MTKTKVRNDIMVDLETLGTSEGSTIFQIAAASFDLTTGEIHDEINLKLNIGKVDDLQVDGKTLKWWLNTDSDLLAELIKEGDLTERDMYIEFAKWVREHESPKLWGNGILFDNAKLQQKMVEHEMRYPIFYRNDRDVRTILDLASTVSGLTEKEIKDSLSDDGGERERAHDAIYDVRWQIRLVNHCYNLLKI